MISVVVDENATKDPQIPQSTSEPIPPATENSVPLVDPKLKEADLGKAMLFEDFCDFLEDIHLNSALDPLHRHVHQDMTQPLCNYFASSSHNTYLTGKER